MHRLATGRLLEKHLRLLSDVAGIERLRLFVREHQQPVRTLLLVLLAHHVGNPEGCRSRTLRIREHMQLRHVQSLQEVVAFLEALRCLAAASHHHVHADEGIRHQRLDQLYLMREERLVITAVHQPQHLVAPALQRDMEMRHEGTALRTIGNQLVRQQVRLYRRNTVAAHALHLVERLHQIRKRLPRRLAEVADVHARQHNLLTPFRSRLLRLFHQ